MICTFRPVQALLEPFADFVRFQMVLRMAEDMRRVPLVQNKRGSVRRRKASSMVPTAVRLTLLAEIEAVTPPAQLPAVIEPHYPKGNRWRPRIGLEWMLRIYIAQKGFGHSDEGIEDVL